MPPHFGGGPKCGVCNKTVYFNEERRALGKIFHGACFTCCSCDKGLDSVSCNEHEEKLYCNSCYGKQFGPKGYGYAGGGSGVMTLTPGSPKCNYGASVSPSKTGDKSDLENCPRCGARVYFAEQILSLGRKWHQLCFKCTDCDKCVDSPSAADHDGDLYCKICYQKNFGIKGIGYGIGAGVLRT